MVDLLYHFSSHPALVSASVGSEFRLDPGTQNAEGLGVYFAESPRKGASDALVTGGKSCTGCVVIDRPATKSGWWVTSAAVARKKNRAKSWHTAGSSLILRVTRIESGEDPLFYCEVLEKTFVEALKPNYR